MDLNNYLQHVASRPDVLNSVPLIRFLQIDSNAPEVLARQPKLIHTLDCVTSPSEQFYVTHVLNLPKHNAFILCLTDLKKKTSSKLELYTFTHLGIMNNSFMDFNNDASPFADFDEDAIQ